MYFGLILYITVFIDLYILFSENIKINKVSKKCYDKKISIDVTFFQ